MGRLDLADVWRDEDDPPNRGWRCKCGQQLASYVTRCPTCGGRPTTSGGARVHDAHAASLYGEEIG